MKNYSILTLLALILSLNSRAQMQFNGQALFGNEWIRYNQSYYKFYTREDGFYRIGYQDLIKAGVPIQSIELKFIKIYKNGTELSLRTSTEGLMTETDFIEFYGTRNRAELDKPLFSTSSIHFNKEFSMFSDNAAYFLTWDNQSVGARMIEKPNDNSNPLAKEISYVKRNVLYFSEVHTKRAHGPKNTLKLPDFDEGQGYGTASFKERTFNLNFKNFNSSAEDAEIKTTVWGTGSGDNTLHKCNFFIDGNQESTLQFSGFKVREENIKLTSDRVNEQMVLKILCNGNPEDKVHLSTIEYRYDAFYKFDNATYSTLIIRPSLTRKTIEIENFDGGAEMMLYDITNNYFIKSQKDPNGIYSIDLPPSDFEREIIILNPSSQFKSVGQVQNVKMAEYEKNNYDFLIVTSKRLRSGNNDEISEYEAYRSSKAGGEYKVKTVYIEDIEDQFGFGIKGHNIALRNFFQYSRTIWSDMHYVLIVGKGLEYIVYRNNTNQYTEFDFVPTYSEPASDYMLVSDENRIPFYTIGRLPVVKSSEIKDYLTKLKEHESYIQSSEYSIKTREWLKRIIHLAGGDPTLYAVLRSQLAGMENEIEQNAYGGNVTTFYKESTSNIEVINSDALQNLINEGVSIISFLGHSNSYKLDFSLAGIDEYLNKGKYHVFLALGCYAGQMYINNRSISETQNLAADKGSIIFISNTTAGLPGILYTFGTDFYSQLGGAYYNKPVGDAVKLVINNLIASKNEAQLYQALSTSFNGDPALRLNNNAEIDVTVDGTTAKHKDKFIFADQKEFTFNVDLLNLGYGTEDSVTVKLENVYPDGSTSIVFNDKILIPLSRSNVEFKIPVDENKSGGYNKLILTIDPENKIKEGPDPYAENNNTLITGMNQTGFDYVVVANNAKILYPSEFAIINQDKPRLVAYNGFLFGKTKYFMELDTTENFNSSLKRSNNMEQLGGVISWPLTESLLPNTVYYWRVRPDSAGTNVLAWKNSSFIYIPGPEIGWNQSHYFQHAKNDLTKMEILETERKYEYVNEVREFRVYNGYIELPTFIRPKIFVGSDVVADFNYWEQRSDLSGIVVAFLDPITGTISKNITGSDFNSVGGSKLAGSAYYLFATNSKEERTKLLDFLKNNIHDKAVVIVQTMVQFNHSLYLSDWASDGPENLISFFKSKGAQNIEQLISAGNVPYNLIYGHNRPDYETKDRIGNLTDELNIGHSFKVRASKGNVKSKIIGPATSYNKFLWNYNLFDANTDTINVEIYGIEAAGNEKLLFGPLDVGEVDLSSVDAKTYPYLRLNWNSKDSKNKTSANLDYWRIYFKGGPDIAFNPALSYKKNFDTLNQGKVFRVDLTAQNVSTYDMDSLLIKFTVIDQSNNPIATEQRYVPVKAFEDLKFFYVIKTTRQFGPYKLIVELNPKQDQPELITFNNTAVIDYFVRKDRRKPYIRVSFDGDVINNGDIVSPSSQIAVLLHDEDNSIPMENPDHFKIKLEYPDQALVSIDPNTLQNVRFNPTNVNSSVNEASIVIDGGLNQEGLYKLYVRAKDGNGNYTSETEEVIEFRVINESSISNVFNYPNPFSTKTRFVYTLTGSTIPDFYKIQIMTISGKVVRELNESDLGQMRIGTHLTEYEYDGTDEFGDKLANGVYLYKAIFKDSEGKEIKKYETGTDSFFKNNLGKMVILR
ncbi:MAG: hypothetical protein HOP11_13065 [Saprospiraceae bacterium]|nr:hypothetical protein [Saprospiraceae bacterium]